MSEWTSGLIRSMLIIAVGSGFQHGYHTGVTNIPEKTFRQWIKTIIIREEGEPPSEKTIMLKWSLTVAIFAMGAIVGSSLTAILADKFGRKKCLLCNSSLELIGVVICLLSQHAKFFELLIIGRCIFGINAGLNWGLCQIYLTEIAPPNIRGVVAGFYQLMITIGIMVSQICGKLLGTRLYWSLIFIVPLIPASIQSMALYFCPESPMYLLICKGDEYKTEKSLASLRGTSDVKEELDTLIESDNLIKELRPTNLKRLLWSNQALRSQLLACLTLMVGQQLCGINVIIYYSTTSLQEMGLAERDIFCVTLAISIINIITTIIGLCVLDSIGRRKLLLLGFLGLAMTTTAGVALFVLVENDIFSRFVLIFPYLLFVMFFAPGLGTIPLFYTAEVFYPTASSLAVSIAMPVNWCANVIVAETFLPLTDVIGFYVYVVFIVLDVFFFISTYIYLQETAKKSVADIIKFYSDNNN